MIGEGQDAVRKQVPEGAYSLSPLLLDNEHLLLRSDQLRFLSLRKTERLENYPRPVRPISHQRSLFGFGLLFEKPRDALPFSGVLVSVSQSPIFLFP